MSTNDPFDSWPSLNGCDQDIRESLKKTGLDDGEILTDSACGDRIMIVIGKGNVILFS